MNERNANRQRICEKRLSESGGPAGWWLVTSFAFVYSPSRSLVVVHHLSATVKIEWANIMFQRMPTLNT